MLKALYFCISVHVLLCWYITALVLYSEPDTSLLDGPSGSGLAPISCAAIGAAATCNPTSSKPADLKTSEENLLNLPNTPNSTSSTAPLVSIPNSPEAVATSTAVPTTTPESTMPAKTALPPIIVTTTTAEIFESRKNRFEILNEIDSNNVEIDELPPIPSNLLLDTSGGTTASAVTSPSTSPIRSTNKRSDSPEKKNSHSRRNHNNNHQEDVNSIESIEDNAVDEKIKNLDWVNQLQEELNNTQATLPKTKNKKKNKPTTAKEKDQLDGVPTKSKGKELPPDEDEKVVKCLYYTLMCCDCSIS
ncbi:cell wall integrity and stress response component 4-like isoform X2 [Teleopsis dalmanni]|uniref:cell wall integrity and stress response component 4-like isoform X2 n=1 Tax=Teleopsis dalmanni TaxID=139649 RepID=UPI0018CF0F01|nr:cell wall integrity and stress response component 4-like isoform X2 [Teleopsis dalmanni]XP_037936430.1 cell wall integrity and stress response component 4-like isoform X2 [Teleopsis dalmanni]